MLFKKKVLSSSVALALVSSTMPALAQDEGLEIEEVIVEGGIRASLKKSMDIKRDTAGVADAISAEDMGKFPDTNLAEALQRVTGVSINRERGEGSKVTVRGFGPEYNMVTLNGRQMPTHSGTSRAYDFADIASEGISAVVVNKTGDATAPSGGIGSTINILTTKPLEAGTVRSIGVKAVIDTSVETGDEISPEIAGLFSETFADDTVGISLSFSAQERNNAERFANVGGWRSQFATADSARYGIGLDTPGELSRQINRPLPADRILQERMDDISRDLAAGTIDQVEADTRIATANDWRSGVENTNTFFNQDCDVNTENCQMESISLPQSVGYNLTEYSSTRLNGQLTMQWRPTDSVTYSVDYTYSELDVENSYNDQSAWFAHQGAVEQTSQWDNAPISTPLVYREVANNSDFAMGLGIQGFTNENESLGFNLDLFVNDRLRLNFDAHMSEARSGANTDYGTSSLITMASFNRTVSKVYFTEDLPILELGLDSDLDATSGELINPITPNESDDPNYQGRTLYPNDMILTGSVFSNGKALMEIDQGRLTGTYDISDISSIDFGIETSKVSNKSVGSNVQRDTWGGISNPADLAHLFIDDNNTPDDSADDTIIYSDMSMNFENISGGDSELRQSESFWADFDGIVDTARSLPADYWTNKVDMQGTCDVDDSEFTQDFEGEAVKTNWYCAADGDKVAGHWDSDLRTTETTNSVFMQYSHEDDFTSVRAGFRYEETEVESTALTPKYIRTQWTGGNEFSLQQDVDEDGNGVMVFVPQTGDYNLFLPNLDIRMNFTDDFIGRISASKTVTRPNYNDIKGGVTPATTYRVGNNNGNISASRGAPDLDPITSNNLDISAEWYYNDASYLSVGWFKKQTSNFIGIETADKPVKLDAYPGLTAVTSGGAWEQAYNVANAVNNDITLSDSDAIKPYLPDAPTPENPLVSVNEDDVAADQALPEDQQQGLVANDIQTFVLSYPDNQKDADVYGWEFNIQHNFGESGFGVIANYTNAWSNVNYVNTPTTEPCEFQAERDAGQKCMITQFALSGLSDSANFIAFYDKNGLNARIAYNWRDDFFAGDGQSQGAFYDDNGDQIGNNPTFVKDYAQVDMSASYEISDNLTIFMDGINITDEGYKNYGRTERQALRVGNTGPRYNLGFRYNF
ncbi:MAG: TonB-dependent receptor [Porticoccaceae bacterium]